MSSPVNQDNTQNYQSGSPKIPVSKDNTVVLEIDNLLANWPTYVLNYTPDQPGTLRIILRLKDITKRADEDDSDTSGSDSESEGDKGVPKEKVKGAHITLHLTSSDEDSDPDKTLTVDAIPVTLNGIPKDIIPIKPKFFDDDKPWPPLRPRALRAIYTNEPVLHFTLLKTIPASVKVIDDDQKHK